MGPKHGAAIVLVRTCLDLSVGIDLKHVCEHVAEGMPTQAACRSRVLARLSVPAMMLAAVVDAQLSKLNGILDPVVFVV